MFSVLSERLIAIQAIANMSPAIALDLVESKLLSFVKVIDLLLPQYSFFICIILTHSHTMTPFDAPGKQAF